MLFKRPFMNNFNEDAKTFFRRNGIFEEDFSKIDMNLRRLVDSSLEDSVLESIAIYDDAKKKDIFIGDILGYNYPSSSDIFLSMGDFFDTEGDQYHIRSIGMLELDKEELLKRLAYSFVVEPIQIKEIHDNRYFIDSNGLHRFTVIKLHYIMEKYRGMDDTLLREKYTFPVMARKLDRVKTYLAYLVSILDDGIKVKKYIDEEYRYTGQILVIENGEKKIFSDEAFVLYVRDLIAIYGVDVSNLFRLDNHVEKNDSFRNFLETYFPDLVMEIERFREYKNSCPALADVYEFQSVFGGKEKNFDGVCKS